MTGEFVPRKELDEKYVSRSECTLIHSATQAAITDLEEKLEIRFRSVELNMDSGLKSLLESQRDMQSTLKSFEFKTDRHFERVNGDLVLNTAFREAHEKLHATEQRLSTQQRNWFMTTIAILVALNGVAATAVTVLTR